MIWSLKFENCQVFRLFAVLNKMQNNHRDGLFHLLRWKACLLNKFPILKVIFFCISITRKGWYILIIALDVSRDWHIVLITLWLMAHCQHICCDPSRCIFWPYSMLPSVWHVSLSSLLSPSSSIFNIIINIQYHRHHCHHAHAHHSRRRRHNCHHDFCHICFTGYALNFTDLPRPSWTRAVFFKKWPWSTADKQALSEKQVLGVFPGISGRGAFWAEAAKNVEWVTMYQERLCGGGWVGRWGPWTS